ncbi:hypothetical protein GGG87_08840 [Streptococcus sp. zg-86]|uniref:Uncharacterized protein n=1 Tax=Streptococcus zhangguiae TaxID=2664091 RepID=A0A6I4REA7_9STRE|nr:MULTISPECIES: hypothetical protein [unclassified Streptococcus]MTB65101.1 hypothetical protein [Streptococcus sp. zg-86]MTB91361.1 hypothetical protein [Streptococcus sp. zg-36]MWV57088.1 hypothetical protein [Streptococcus sp. zg-70]QTH47830.1 hypothetical protein J5M87_00285 [Streptococcus sp. zg-86]
MKKYLKFLVTTNDLFNVVTIIIALILSWLGTSTIFDGKLDLNSKYPIFLYATITTLTSAIVDPILEIFRVESKKKKLFTLTLGVVTSLILGMSSFYNNYIFLSIQSISKRGGFSAISVSLLLLNLAYINYQVQVQKEKEILQEKNEKKEILTENIRLKKKLLNKEIEK